MQAVIDEWLCGENSTTKAPKREMAQWKKLGTVAIYGISGCAIRGTSARQRPHSSFTSNKRYNADILGACSKLHSFDERKALTA
jgi:hypothetical protein